MKINRSYVVGSILICLLLSSCALRNNSGGTPQLQTALQQTITYNAIVAKTNRAVEQAVETVQTSGALTTAQARPVIVGCGKVAQVSESIRGITSQGTEASWAVDGPKIRALLASASLNLPASQNQAVDLAVAAVNAAIVLLTQGVK